MVFNLPMLLGAFQPLKPDNRICCDTHLMVMGRSFMYSNHLPSPGLCKVLELGIDRANEVELLCVLPRFALFFPGDVCASGACSHKSQ